MHRQRLRVAVLRGERNGRLDGLLGLDGEAVGVHVDLSLADLDLSPLLQPREHRTLRGRRGGLQCWRRPPPAPRRRRSRRRARARPRTAPGPPARAAGCRRAMRARCMVPEDLGPEDVRHVVRDPRRAKTPDSAPAAQHVGELVDAARHALARAAATRTRTRSRAARSPGAASARASCRGRPGSAGRSARRPRSRARAARPDRRRRRSPRLELAGELVEVVGDREDVELLLRGELAVDQPARDADRLGDLLDRRVQHAALVEQRPRGRHQLALAHAPEFGGLASGHGPSLASDATVANAWLTHVLIVSRPWLSAAPARRSRSGACGRCAPCAPLFTPLLPDDYLELINPLWSTQELRGRIERIEPRDRRRGDDRDQAGLGVGGPRAGPVPAHRRGRRRRPPLARLLADLRPGPRRTAASASRRSSSRRARSRPTSSAQAQPGAIVRLGGVEGTFVLPDPLPEKLPLHQRGQRHHADHEHAARARAPRRARATSCSCTPRARPTT